MDRARLEQEFCLINAEFGAILDEYLGAKGHSACMEARDYVVR